MCDFSKGISALVAWAYWIFSGFRRTLSRPVSQEGQEYAYLDKVLKTGGDIEAVGIHCQHKWTLNAGEKARVLNQDQTQ